jgi:hypothetical protein
MRFILWEDTSPEAEQVLLAGYRAMSPAKKLRQVEELTRGVQQLALARLRAEDPDASPRTLQLRLAALWIEPELLARVLDHERRRAG